MDRIFLSPPDVGALEKEALLRAFDSGWVAPVGPEIDGFEKDMAAFLTQARQSMPASLAASDPSTEEIHCTALTSGTAALHLALLLAGIRTGDRVLVSDFTFVASANAVRYCGAEPVFIDSERRSWNLDPDLLAEALQTLARTGRLPRALICTDLYGQCADYTRIVPLCREYGVTLIQDSAEAVGALSLSGPAGLQGDFGIFSFNGNKLLTTGGGGILITKDRSLADRARFLATQAKEPAPHYQHKEIGFNYRMGNLTAALGRGQLARLPKLIEQRKKTFDFYRSALSHREEVQWIPYGASGQPNYWLSCLILDPTKTTRTPEEIRLALEARRIESRPLWKPMHLQPLYQESQVFGGSVSEDLFARGLCLPSGSQLQDEDRERVVQAVREALEV